MRFRIFPNGVRIGRGHFALPEQRGPRRKCAVFDSNSLHGSVIRNQALGGGQIWNRDEEILKSHHGEGALHWVTDGKKHKLLARLTSPLLQSNNQTDSGR